MDESAHSQTAATLQPENTPDLSTVATPRDSARRWSAIFLVTVIVTAAGVLVAGWFTELQDVAYGALTGVALLAFLPFAIAVAGAGLIVLSVVMAVFLGLFGDAGGAEAVGEGGSGLIDLGSGIFGPYYAFLARRRHPMFWGAPVGVLIGGLVLSGLIFWWIIPGETRTATVLVDTSEKLRAHYDEHKEFPLPDSEGRLVLDETTGPVRDGFGHPLRYEREGVWLMSSYTLVSDGYDPTSSKDDMCISGQSEATTYARMGTALASFIVKRVSGEPLMVKDGIKAVLALKCAGNRLSDGT